MAADPQVTRAGEPSGADAGPPRRSGALSRSCGPPGLGHTSPQARRSVLEGAASRRCPCLTRPQNAVEGGGVALRETELLLLLASRAPEVTMTRG